MSNEFIVYILHSAINASDNSIPTTLNNLFHHLQLAGVNFSSLDNEGMVEFTASLAECIQAGIDKEKLHADHILFSAKAPTTYSIISPTTTPIKMPKIAPAKTSRGR